MNIFDDFLGNFEDFDDSTKQVAHSAREFVEQEVLPSISAHYEAGTFDKGLIKKMADNGYFGAQLSGYGCSGLDALSYGLLLKELERGDSGLRSFVSVQSALVMHPIFAFGSDEQKKRWLPQLAAGELVGCFGLTEEQGGSNPKAMRTNLKKRGDDFILNGAKTWITNAQIADIALVWAQSDDGVRGVMVEKDQQGYSSQAIKHKLSMRASLTGSLFFDDVVIPQSHVLENACGLKCALECLGEARYGITFGVLGAAEDCLLEALDTVMTRNVFNKPLAAHQLIQRKLAIMTTKLSTSNLLALRLAELKEQKRLTPAQISMGKQNNCEVALLIARTCRDILGANGISGELKTMRHMCNLETVYTYEGTNDIHLLAMGKEITGLDAFA